MLSQKTFWWLMPKQCHHWQGKTKDHRNHPARCGHACCARISTDRPACSLCAENDSFGLRFPRNQPANMAISPELAGKPRATSIARHSNSIFYSAFSYGYQINRNFKQIYKNAPIPSHSRHYRKRKRTHPKRSWVGTEAIQQSRAAVGKTRASP